MSEFKYNVKFISGIFMSPYLWCLNTIDYQHWHLPNFRNDIMYFKHFDDAIFFWLVWGKYA